MDEKIRNIEWYVYIKSPRHTAFREHRLIGYFRHKAEDKWTGAKRRSLSYFARAPIELLNVLIFKAADFVLFAYEISRFLFAGISSARIRAPPVQEFFQKILEFKEEMPCGREITDEQNQRSYRTILRHM